MSSLSLRRRHRKPSASSTYQWCRPTPAAWLCAAGTSKVMWLCCIHSMMLWACCELLRCSTLETDASPPAPTATSRNGVMLRTCGDLLQCMSAFKVAAAPLPLYPSPPCNQPLPHGSLATCEASVEKKLRTLRFVVPCFVGFIPMAMLNTTTQFRVLTRETEIRKERGTRPLHDTLVAFWCQRKHFCQVLM